MATGPEVVQQVKDAADASPFSWRELLPTLGVVAVAMLGGIASFMRKLRENHARAFNIVEFVGELFISAFAGLLTYWICRWLKADMWLTAVACGIAGHMGARWLFILERALEARVRVRDENSRG